MAVAEHRMRLQREFKRSTGLTKYPQLRRWRALSQKRIYMDRPYRRSAAGIAAAIPVALLVLGSSSTLASLLPQGAERHSLGAASAELVSAVHEEASRLSHDAPSATYRLTQYMIDVAPNTQVALHVTVVCPDQYMIDSCKIGPTSYP
jgi:hypothetical protein